jgi:hypothetical protein
MLRIVVAAFFGLMPVLAWAQSAPTFLIDAKTGCRVGTFSPEAQLSVHWSGPCVSGQAEGSGIAEWGLAGVFASRTEATFHGGLPEGRGIKVTAENRRYEAEFRGGRMNGRCVMTTPDVRVDGQCVDDLFSGPGKATWPDGDRYEGNFRDSKITGHGVWTFGNGGRYEGDFVDAKLNGRGRAVYADGDRYEGDYVEGDYNGTGTYTWADGSVYEGEWSDGKPNGRGTFHGYTHGLLGTFKHDFSGSWIAGCYRVGEYTAHVMTSAQACGFDD